LKTHVPELKFNDLIPNHTKSATFFIAGAKKRMEIAMQRYEEEGKP